MKNRLFLQLLLGFALLCTPAVALAQTGPVHRALTGGMTGGVIDPYATTTLHVVPPEGGTVFLYRGNTVAGWWTQPAFVAVQPNRVYGIAAIRGKTLIYGARLMMRRGHTEIIWEGGNQPFIGFQPVYDPHHRRPAAHRGRSSQGSHHAPAARRHRPTSAQRPASTSKTPRSALVRRTPKRRVTIGNGDHRRLLRRLDSQRSDRQRLRTVKNEAKKHRFSSSQARHVVNRFKSRSYRKQAASALRNKTVKRSRRSPVKRVVKPRPKRVVRR